MTSTAGQGGPADAALSEVASEVADRLGVVGAQVAVLADGAVREGVAGLESVRTRLPVVPETLFQIGSTTKVHTAALLMQLLDQGLVTLDDPVVDQLPGFRLSDPQATAAVTPRQLMSMSSGIDNGPYSDHGRGDDALAGYVAALSRLPHSFAPGTGFGYSNASTCVTGRLVEHVLGISWEQAMTERLLEPCGLRNSAIHAEDVIWRRFALGHSAAGEYLESWTLPRALSPAGALCSSAGDLARFAHVFLSCGSSLAGQRILSTRSVAAMQAREVEVPGTLLAEWWGLGPYGKTWSGADVVGHSGSSLGGSSYLLWAPGRGVAVATTVNTPKLGYRFADEVFRVVFPEHGIDVPLPAVPAENVEVDEPRLVGSYAMSGLTLTVTSEGDGLRLSGVGDVPGWQPSPPSRLLPLTSTTFLAEDPAVSGGRGWALAFVGPADRPATHLVNGFFALRRVA